MIFEVFKWLLNPKKEKLPPFLIFFVTNKCNSRCNHCFLWGDLNKKIDELSLQEIEKISKNLDKLIWLYISGGEPFLRQDLAEICELFFKNNDAKKISIPTNCLLPETVRKTTENILEKCPGIGLTLNLSLDGLEQTHDKIRGAKGNFKKVVETEKIVRRLKEKHPNLSHVVCTTACKENLQEIPELMDFVKKNMDADFHGLEIIRGSPKQANYLSLGERQLQEVFEKYGESNKHYFFKKDNRYAQGNAFSRAVFETVFYRLNLLMNKLQLKVFSEKRQVIPCVSANNVTLVIDPNGDVKHCELLPPIGNLRERDFDVKKVLFSDAAIRQRAFIASKRCYCTHALFLTRSILFNPRCYPGLVSGKLIGV